MIDSLKSILDLIAETQSKFFPGVHIFFIPGSWYVTGMAKSFLKAIKVSDRWYDFWCKFTPILLGIIYMLTIANNRDPQNVLRYKLVMTNIVLGFLLGASSAFFYSILKPFIKFIHSKTFGKLLRSNIKEE